MRLKLITGAGEHVRVRAVRGKDAKRGYRGLPPPRLGEGLLFPFGRRKQIPDFTMSGVPFDLDLVVLDQSSGVPCYTVVAVHRLVAGTPRHPVGATGVAALEIAAGEAERLGLGPGSMMAISW